MSELTKEKRAEILLLRKHYRNVFAGSSGHVVFHDLLTRCYFFNDDITPEAWEMIARRNFIMEIIELLGCADNPELTTKAIRESILKLPLTTKKDEE